MKTILAVNDHPIVLEGLHKVLAGRGYKVVKAKSAEEALTLGKTFDSISLFLVDLSLKGEMSTMQLIEELRRCGLNQPVVVYVLKEHPHQILALEDADVDGVVIKGDDVQDLTFAIRQVLDKGERYRSGGFDNKLVEMKMLIRQLSTKDLDVLRKLANGQSNREIAETMGLSEKTVEYHRSNILKKLGVKSMLEAIRMAISLGIIE